jgi:hypothetical protein
MARFLEAERPGFFALNSIFRLLRFLSSASADPLANLLVYLSYEYNLQPGVTLGPQAVE